MTATEVLASCSFSLKEYTDVGTLVAGPGVYICDECVALCSQLIASKPKSVKPRPAQRIAPWESEARLDAILASLPRVAQAGNQAEYTVTQYIRKLVNSGLLGRRSDNPWV